MRSLSYAAGKYPDFAQVLKNFKETEGTLIDAVNDLLKARGKEPIQSTAVALSMIGFTPARNFLASSIVNKKNRKLTPWDTGVARTLNFAIAGEAAGGNMGLRYFTAGMIFDIIISLYVPPEPDGSIKRIPQYAKDLWKHGIAVSSIANHLAERLIPQIDLERDICIDGLLHDIGKLVAFFLNGEYPMAEGSAPALAETQPGALTADVPASDIPSVTKKMLPEAAWMAEVEAGPFPHDVLGHLVLWRLGFLEETSWVTMYHHQPFLAAKKGNVVHMRATLIWLADHLYRFHDYHHVDRFVDETINRYYDVVSKVFKNCKKDEFKRAVNSISFRF